MTEQEVWDGLKEVFAETFDDDTLSITRETTADDVPGWDSMKMVTLLITIQERFHIRARSQEIESLKSVGDLADLVQRKAA